MATKRNTWMSLASAALHALILFGTEHTRAEVSYNRDIRPVLSDNCFLCHGPDQNTRKAKLRLDLRESALEKEAFVPGKPDESELIKRILSTDVDEVMPPLDSHKKLTAAQKETFRQWIAEGAQYQTHWAYIPPVKAEIPTGKNGVDHLVQERLKIVGMKTSAEADKRILARRLFFDLWGLPPSAAEIDSFVHDKTGEGYKNLVEKLLSSAQYGERMAVGWLDVVRFADTIGYHSDNPRNIWPYRDYVIRAFNENKPFDQFTVEQLAGDLLPNAGLEQKVGSAFNRLLLSTEEGGAQPKDYEYRMLTDRVRAVGTVWLGQTLGCAACHDHKFDPTSSKDFYSMGAFFADLQEPIIGKREDGMLVPNPSQESELRRLNEELEKLQKRYNGDHPDLAEAFAQWEKAQIDALEGTKYWRVLTASELKSANGATLKVQDGGSILAQDKKPEKDTYTLVITNTPPHVAGLKLEVLPHDSLPSKGPGRASNGNVVITEILAKIRRVEGKEEPLKFKSAKATIEQSAGAENPYKGWIAAATIDADVKGEGFGWAILPEAGKPNQLLLELFQPVSVGDGDLLVIEILQNHGQGHHTLGHFRVSATEKNEIVTGPAALPPKKALVELLVVPASERNGAQRQKLLDEFKAMAPELSKLREDLAAAKKAKSDYEGTIARCIVSNSGDPRTVRILPRGNFLQEEKGEKVLPALPAYLPGARTSTGQERLTRLDLAKWMTSRDNPLPARVTMNRLWKQFFGTGLSKVLDDLGAQGEPPPNGALLDWLACEFMDSGWNMKHMVRLIVNSHTYKQVSTQTAEQRARDPDNRELATQSRWRLDAEFVRDNALAISRLLVPTVGGPSVRPYQPDGYWENLNFPPRTYEASKNMDQYRRGLYTWWQRSFVHPSMIAFDAPTREECAAERNRSNIPQQALVLLNDPTYVEASRAFAIRILKEGGRDHSSKINWAVKEALGRKADPEEVQILQELALKHLAEFEANPSSAEAFIKVGFHPPPPELKPSELAAWTNLARVILNLHETITRS